MNILRFGVVLAVCSRFSMQDECTQDHTMNSSWMTEWCLKKGCYFDNTTKMCQLCTPCEKGTHDGPILQCQVDLYNSNRICGVSKFKSFLGDRYCILGLFFCSSVTTLVVTYLLYICCLKHRYWRHLVKKTDRYKASLSVEKYFSKNDMLLFHQKVASKVQKLSQNLSISIQRVDHGGSVYSDEEKCYRYLNTVSSKRGLHIISDALCSLGFGKLVYSILIGNEEAPKYHISEDQAIISLDDDTILDVASKVSEDQNCMKIQFQLALLLGLSLVELDNCREINGAQSTDAMQQMFMEWKFKARDNFTYGYLKWVFQTLNCSHLVD